MTHSVSRRRRLVDVLTLVLASVGVSSLAAAQATPADPSGQALCAGPVLEKAGGGLALQYIDGGWTLVDIAAADAVKACQLKATAAGLNMLFADTGDVAAVLAQPPQFVLQAGANAATHPARRFEVVFTEPVLCESYYPSTSADLLALRLTDPNGRSQVLRGVDGLAYHLPAVGSTTSARFVPAMEVAAHGPQVQCHAVPYATLQAGAPDVPAPGMAPSGSIFGSGFEVVATPSQRADIRVEILDGPAEDPDAFLVRNLQAIVNNPFQYSIRVRNAGGASASGLRLREFVADVAAPTGLLTPTVQPQEWTCSARSAGQSQVEAGTDCGSGSGVLAVDGAGFSLAAGASRTYRLTRNVPVANTGDRSVVAAAVFINPADAVAQGDLALSDNVAKAVVELTVNPGPTIVCAADAANAAPFNTGNLPATVALQEDAAALVFTCSLSDSDGVANLVASSSNGTLLPTASLLGSRAGDTWPLTIAPVAERSGSSNLLLTATDTLGASRQLAVTVNVASVNDQPSFDMLVTALQLDPAGGLPRDGDGVMVDATRTGCLSQASGSGECQITINNFFSGVDAGPPGEESGQTVMPLAPDCTASSGPVGQMFTVPPTITPATAQPSGSNFGLTFNYDKSFPDTVTVRCQMRFQDNGTPAATSADSPTFTEIEFSRYNGD